MDFWREAARIQDKNAGVPESVGTNAPQSHSFRKGVKSLELRWSIRQWAWRGGRRPYGRGEGGKDKEVRGRWLG